MNGLYCSPFLFVKITIYNSKNITKTQYVENIKKVLKILKKHLQLCCIYGNILRYAVEVWREKHALMREVAHLEWGNFRGVCPILNRAKELRKHKKKLANFLCNGQAIGCPELTATPAIAGFIMR